MATSKHSIYDVRRNTHSRRSYAGADVMRLCERAERRFVRPFLVTPKVVSQEEAERAEHAIRARIEKRKWMSWFFPKEEQGFGPGLYLLFGNNWHRRSGYEFTVSGSSYKSMAHLMHAIGAFPSVAEARRNGHNKPVTNGLHFVRIRGHKHRMIIENS